MRLGFVGADHEVTGSCHYLEVCGKHILVDCGLEQGKDIYVNQDIIYWTASLAIFAI